MLSLTKKRGHALPLTFFIQNKLYKNTFIYISKKFLMCKFCAKKWGGGGCPVSEIQLKLYSFNYRQRACICIDG